MYGLVNAAFADLIRSSYGDEAWNSVRKASNVSETRFLTMRVYDDKITYDMVGAAAQELNKPVNDILREFGRYWLAFVRAQKMAAPVLRSIGVTMDSALRSLDAMHVRISAGMPQLQPPSFEIEELADRDSIRVHYRSHRPGLAPFVHGLLEGLAEMLNQEVEIVVTTAPDDDHETFDVTVLHVVAS